MPFERYLAVADGDPDYSYDERNGAQQQQGSSTGHAVHFQLPQFMLPPTLAPGGGAEVVPVGLYDFGEPSAGWYGDSA